MMRTSPNRNRNALLQHPVVAAALVIFVIVVLYLLYSVFSTGIWGMSAPLLTAHNSLQGFVNDIGSPFTSKATLLAENQMLTEELASTTAVLADRNALYQ